MNVRARAELALLAAMETLLESKVIELALEACVLRMTVILPEDKVLESLWLVNYDLANPGNASAHVIGFVLGWDLPGEQVGVGWIT